jgi:lactoylglutathione lyase
VAFECDDLVAEKAAVEARGGVFTTDVHLVDSGPFAGLRTAFLHDPDGVRIEVVEVAYRLDGRRRDGVARYWARRRSQAAK